MRGAGFSVETVETAAINKVKVKRAEFRKYTVFLFGDFGERALRSFLGSARKQTRSPQGY